MPHPSPRTEAQTNTVGVIFTLSNYAAAFAVERESAIETARHCLIHCLGRGFEALRDPECAPLVGPVVPGALMPGGARVPGTSLELEPVQAAFCIGLLFCRRVSADHWLASVRAYAGDWLGAILAVADHQARKAAMEGRTPPRVRDLLIAIVKALEIQAVLASIEEEEDPAAADESIRLARAAATAVVAAQLGGTPGQIATAVSYSSLDGEMFVHPDEPYTVARGYWAAADTISRGVRRAYQATAADRPAFLTAVDLTIVELADSQLGTTPFTPRKSFGTAAVDRLARARRPQDVARLMSGFNAAVEASFPARQAERIKALFAAPRELDELPVNELIAALVTNGAAQR
jgi:2-methylcitrate dehydratase